jgi:cytochrome c553
MRKTILTVAALAFASVATLPAQDAKQAEKGQQIFTARKCAGACHTLGDKADPKKSALDGVGAKYTAAELKEWLTTPAEMQKKSKTASTRKPLHPKLEPADLDALVAYLQTLKKK